MEIGEGDTMIKDMSFIKENGMKIRGRMYLPETGEGKLPLVIFSHGFGSNYRELMHHGDGFAGAGICCLFFDFCGGGMESQSDGKMRDMTIGSECGDLKTVLACAMELDYVDREKVFLLGESMGGLVSALVAAQCPDEIRGMVLWYPAFVISEDAGKRQVSGRTDVFGIELDRAFDEEAAKLDVYGIIPRYRRPVLLIHGDRDQIVPLSFSERAVPVYEDARLIVMPGAGHGYDGADSAAAREYSIAFIREHCG